MNDQHPRPADAADRPMFWEHSIAFLKWAIVLILGSSAVYLIVVFVVAPEQMRTARGGGPTVLSLIALAALVLLLRGKIKTSVHVLAAGLWLHATGIVLLFGGLNSAFIITYPLIIIGAGWLLGPRTAVVYAVLTAAACLGFYQAESLGLLPLRPPTSPALLLVVQISVFSISALLITYLVRSYRNQLAVVRKLGSDLALRTAEVQAHEAELNRAQAVAHVGSWVYEFVTDTMRLSAEACRIFGLPEGTTGSRNSYLARVHEEDRSAVDSAWQAAVERGGPFDNEHRILVGNTLHWVRHKAELEFGAGGRLVRGVGTTQDITELKRHETEVLAARSQLDATLEAIPDLMFDVGLDGRFHDYHSPHSEFLIASPEDFLGKTVSDFLPPEAAEVAMSALREAHETGGSQGKQYRLDLAQGRFWFELSVSCKSVGPGQEPRFIALSRDITERKRVEEELRQRNVFVESLLENAPIGFAVNRMDDGQPVFVGRNFEKIYGLAPGSIHSTADFFEQVYPDPVEREKIRVRIMADIASGDAARMRWEDIPIRTAAGEERFVTASNIALPEQNLMISAVQDVSDAHRAQVALRASEQRYRTLFAHGNIAMLLFDPADGAIVDANAAACAYYGWEQRELQAMRIWDINTFGADALRVDIDRARNQVRGHFDFRHRLASGEIRDVEVSTGPVEIDGRELLLSIVQDVTERNRAQEELKKSTAFLELLLESMPLPVFYKDASACYAGCNSAFAKFIGKSRAEIVGKTVFEVLPHARAQIYRDKDLDLLTGVVDVQTYESRVAHADGTPHDVIVHKARMLDDAGTTAGILGVITDITEIRRMEAARDQLQAQLRESQKMEALGTLAGGVAHDFNNVLAAIIGNVELAHQDVGPGHVALESLEEIRKASRRATDLVQQILAFGRRQVLAREVIPLAPVLEESVRLLRTTLPAGVRLRVQCAPDAPAVLADATQVQQVLVNLCTNAWQAMDGQTRPGVIVVGLEACQHAADGAQSARAADLHGDLGSGRYACLTVRDNGSGMDEATLARIFEPFYTTKPMGKGTGLGLAVVHGIVQSHGAGIEVKSVPGAGTTFRIYFPAVEALAPAATAPAAEGARAHGQGRRILYVDDDEAIVFLMTRLLERQGYHVSGYTDPVEALEAVRAQPDAFDLAVTDYNMPGMSGLEVAQALKEMRADLPVALASGYITEELRAQAPAAGVLELVYKPNTVDELYDVIARLATTLPA
ncbi:MAG: PAS domain S-box protein [Burkholderiales bacterium]|nr:PAS domain S-box protein [Burkholderiales bacterium]